MGEGGEAGMKWTKTPPTEPGWYWVRTVIQEQNWIGQPKPVEWSPGDWVMYGSEHREFWPVPLLPPEETP